MWAPALAAFLARGGIVPFIVPIVVVPTVVGIATFIGADAITVAGLSPEFIALLVAVGFALAVWLLLGTVIGAVADTALVRAVATGGPEMAPGGPEIAPGPGPAAVGPGDLRGLVVRLVAIRLVLALPLVVAAAWGASRVITVGYGELIQPGNLATPFLVRVLEGVPEVAVAVGLAWLAGELVGGIAVRLVVIDGRSPARALGGAVLRIVQRPLATLAVAIVTLGLAIASSGAVLALAALAWTLLLPELLAPTPSLITVGLLAGGFVVAWAVSLLVAGIAAAWRSAAWSLYVTRDHRGAGGRDSERVNL